jgi:hypothetical protein
MIANVMGGSETAQKVNVCKQLWKMGRTDFTDTMESK